MSTLQTRPLFTLSLELQPVLDVGRTPLGHRRVFPVAGGSFVGERLRGVVLPQASGDWLLQRGDGSFQQDVRLTLQEEDGSLILMSYRGVRHASDEVSERIVRGERVEGSEYYLRIAPFFETAGAAHLWLNHVVVVGIGERAPGAVVYELFEVL